MIQEGKENYEKDGSEIHPGTERQGIGFHFFFYADEALKIVAITMDSACWAVQMKNGDQTKKSLWP